MWRSAWPAAADILQAAFLKGEGGRGPRAGERRGVVLQLLRNAITDYHRYRVSDRHIRNLRPKKLRLCLRSASKRGILRH